MGGGGGGGGGGLGVINRGGGEECPTEARCSEHKIRKAAWLVCIMVEL